MVPVPSMRASGFCALHACTWCRCPPCVQVVFVPSMCAHGAGALHACKWFLCPPCVHMVPVPSMRASGFCGLHACTWCRCPPCVLQMVLGCVLVTVRVRCTGTLRHAEHTHACPACGTGAWQHFSHLDVLIRALGFPDNCFRRSLL